MVLYKKIEKVIQQNEKTIEKFSIKQYMINQTIYKNQQIIQKSHLINQKRISHINTETSKTP